METLKVKITNIGRRGDPFGNNGMGKAIFVKGSNTLKIGDMVECEPVHENDTRIVAKFSKIISEGPIQQPKELEKWRKVDLLRQHFPVLKVLNSNSRGLLVNDTAARNLAYYILEQREGPAPAKYDYSTFCHAFLELRAAGLLAMIPPDKWCFSGEDFVKVNCKSAEIEFIMRDDIRKEIKGFLDNKVRQEFARVSRR